MTRAIRLSCVALLFVALGAASAFAKPTIAVLGLEVIDKSGTPTPVDTQVAQELTTGLRDRVKTGGPYQSAPNSDKELIDEKLLKNCDDEKPTCMAAIGTELTADFLMYGSITKQGGAYQVTVNLLDIKRKHKDNTTVLIPIAESSGTAVKAWAKKIYSSLTGQVDTCSLVIKTTGGVDKGTILINNEPKGNISAGSGEVKGLAEGKYAVAVDAKDFKRFESPNVNCVAGQTVTINPDMAKIDLSLGNGNGSGSGSGSDGGMGLGSGSGSGETGTVTHPKSNKGIWKAVAWGALAGTALAGGAWAYGYFVDESPYRGKTWEITDANGTITVPGMINGQAAQVPKIFDESQCSQTGTLSANDTTGLTTTMNPPPKWDRAPWGNNQFKKACTGYSITKFAVPLTFGLAAVAIGGFIMAARAPDKESPVQVSRTGGTPSASNGHRVKRQPFVIVPVVGPNGGGATFAMEW